jgi:ParB family chromosome partitioning protein
VRTSTRSTKRTAYQRLADQFALTQDQIAAAVGKDRSSVANFMRLLKLPEEVRAEVAAGRLSMGHARALLGVADPAAQRHAAREVISRALSVRETESLVKDLATPKATRAQKRASDDEGAAVAPAEKDVPHPRRRRTACVSRSGRKSGSSAAARAVQLKSTSRPEDELNRLYELLTATR